MTLNIHKLPLFLSGLVLFLFSCTAAFAVSERTLSVRGGDNFPPFEFINERGKPDGFNVDIFKALMKELKYDYELKLEEWEKVQEEITERKVDIVIGMLYSPERATEVRFSLPTCIVHRNFITRKADRYKSFEALRGKEIIVKKGGWFYNYLRQHPAGRKIIESNNINESLQLLLSGKHDAILCSELEAFYAMKQTGAKGLVIGDIGIPPQNYALAVKRNNDNLLYELNIGLQQLKASGVYDQIYNKWFGIYEAKRYGKPLFVALCIILTVVVLLLLFVWLLRKQVSKATRMLNYSRQEVGIAIDAGSLSAWSYLIGGKTVQALHGNPVWGEKKHIDEILRMVHPGDAELMRKCFEELSEGTKGKMELSFRIREAADRPYRYFETRMVRVEASKEHPCRIVGTLKEITEEVQMRSKLEDFRIKSEFIIKSNDIVLLEYDTVTRTFTQIDDSGDNQARYTTAEYAELVHPNDRQAMARFTSELNTATNSRINGEFRMRQEDGKYEWYSFNMAAYKYDSRGNIIHYIGLRRNNTKWKQMVNDLIVLRKKAEASNKLKSAFLANMSHEIRTPLNAIVGFSELIIDSEDREEKRNFIEIVRTNNDLLLQLINDVLDLSKIEAGYINLQYAEFDFSAHFSELGTSLGIKATEAVELKVVNRYPELYICSDKSRLSQVITNFVNNAFKFTHKGSITMDYLYEDESIRVSVTDTGIGIEEENLRKIFNRFEKINNFAQGTGLGLSICKVIIEAMHGEIGAESKPGEGSTFWFRIPCNALPGGIQEETNRTGKEEFTPEEEETGTEDFPEADVQDEKKTVLVAEDLDSNYIIVRTILRGQYRLIRATDGADAVEKTKIYHPDIILMDMKMPVMDGLSATREIRRFNRSVPIIALTAYVLDTKREDALDAGCNEFMTKPLNKNTLIDLISGCMK
ncbi:MAG: transporter substrate-binding domain-containing protein [Bacteroidales bacterium]|nr:transporter substrate-binding domain-containing protein [Bacteroidales bacterium]